MVTLIAAYFVLAGSPSSQQMSALVFQDHDSFWVDTPRGWVVDSEIPKRQGLSPVFYPVGATWESADSVMYARLMSRSADESFEAAVQRDVVVTEKKTASQPSAQWRGLVRREKSSSPRAIKGRSVVVNFFNGQPGPNAYEIVAYVDAAAKSVVLLVLSAKTIMAFEEALPAFRELVSSYGPGPKVIKSE